MKVPLIFATVLSRRPHVGPPGTMVQDGNTSVENVNESVISTEGTVKLGIPSRKNIVREHVSSLVERFDIEPLSDFSAK